MLLPALLQGAGARSLETLAPTLQRLEECGSVSRSPTPLFGNSQKADCHQTSKFRILTRCHIPAHRTLAPGGTIYSEQEAKRAKSTVTCGDIRTDITPPFLPFHAMAPGRPTISLCTALPGRVRC